MTALLVAVGAAVGAALRYLTDRAVTARLRSPLPWGTLVVNVTGSFLLGLLVGWPAAPAVAALLGAGLCGGLSTYSTFSYETLRLYRAGRRRLAVLNVVLSAGVTLVAAGAGLLLARAVAG